VTNLCIDERGETRQGGVIKRDCVWPPEWQRNAKVI
jgi:hypothetical protein